MSETYFSITTVARLLGVAEHRLNYAHRAHKLPEPRQFAGRRMYTKADIERLAQHFGVEMPELPGGDHE